MFGNIATLPSFILQEFFNSVSLFFAEIYVIEKGKKKNQRLAVGSIMQYVSGIYNILSKNINN